MTQVDILHSYWQGVLQRLQAEVENMNQLIGHQGVKGTENEAALARVVEQLIPHRYSVGSGLVIDSQGSSSKQMDLVVYDSGAQPALLAQTTQVLFPVETVRLCIEVKTSIGSTEVADSREKAASLAALNSHSTTPPLGLFGFRAITRAKAIRDNLADEITDYGPRPAFVCIPELAFIATTNAGSWQSALTPLHTQDDQGKALLGEYESPRDEEKDAWALRDGHRYPIIDREPDYILGDPSRALLLFSEQVLQATDSSAASTMAAYMNAVVRDVALI
ncbi:DUF6602 domain-containing protein [Curtobacterium flaccumfaciens]|uniref:DUF6602 domain-containing protein n=1 Tax=Curtobacterium flaccumfaciens TaxID=2035 RepID=UPI001604819B|nr:DUF6602 domain-containing protein [Curtobacterium flaccumfaciens]MBB1198678.1 hypothetical protein [Curtobacterium flaccumfaciens]